MLIHITPRFLSCQVSGPTPVLEELDIPAFKFRGVHGKELATRRPYPNKRYRVGCRKIGKTAVSGFLFDVKDAPDHFEVIERWRFSDSGVLVHKVNYFINDQEFDTASDAMILWAGLSEDGYNFKNRDIEEYANASPAEAWPIMAATPDSGKKGIFTDVVEGGLLLKREETFIMPTIEKERLTSGFGNSLRTPSPDLAIKIDLTGEKK